MQGLPRVAAGDLLLEERAGRREQADGHAGQCRVDTRLQQREPDADTHDGVDDDGPDAQQASHEHRGQQTDRDRQPAEGEVVGVEDRDHQDRADVVDDRQRQQEQSRGRGDPASQHAKDADREGDVGRHRNPPARCSVAAGRVEGDVEHGRDHHPADRRHDGQRRGPGVAQVAVDQLVLDLEPDHEEEDHHQRVVDPVLQGLVELEGAGVEGDAGVPEGVVGVRPGAVGPDQCCRGGEEQHERARRLDAQELAHRSRDEARERLVARHVGRAGLPEVVADARVVVRVVGSSGHGLADPSRIVGAASPRRSPRADQTSRLT